MKLLLVKVQSTKYIVENFLRTQPAEAIIRSRWSKNLMEKIWKVRREGERNRECMGRVHKNRQPQTHAHTHTHPPLLCTFQRSSFPLASSFLFSSINQLDQVRKVCITLWYDWYIHPSSSWFYESILLLPLYAPSGNNTIRESIQSKT